MKSIFLLTLVCLSFVLAGEASAAKTFQVYNYALIGSATLSTGSCEALNALPTVKILGPVTCGDLDAVIKARGGSFTATDKNGQTYWVSLSVSGGCKAGTDVGSTTIPVAYTKPGSIDTVLQRIQDPMAAKGNFKGCATAASELGGCFWHEAVNGAQLKECTVYLQETGEDGGADSSPDTTAPAYGGGGDGGGGGTTPGDGGGGTTPGDGGGTTPGGGGTTPGGGGTTPGDGGGGTTPGGGGTTPGGGTGGGGDGDSQANCGAPGQPACKIDESGTPDGKGILDALMKLVEGLGDDRQKGLDDAASDNGKDTSLGFSSLNLPSGTCVNPTVQLPGIGGSWSVDICSYIGLLGDMFEAFWAFAFAFAVMSMVSRATQKPVA